jgi:sigma-B regulation protein RsbU (phosphoserine phosphatase)
MASVGLVSGEEQVLGVPEVLAPRRLLAVHETGLLDTGPDEAFDRLARLATKLLDVPYAFVTIVDESRSFWKSCIGVDATALSDRQNPVEESFCQYVINTDEALVVGDARMNPMTSTNPSIEKMGVLAWAGYPLRSRGGEVLGTFCVVDTTAREWTEDEVEVIASLAGAVEGEIRLRVLLDEAAAAADRAHDAAALRDRLTSLAERLASADTTSTVARAITELGPTALDASIATLGIVWSDEIRRSTPGRRGW